MTIWAEEEQWFAKLHNQLRIWEPIGWSQPLQDTCNGSSDTKTRKPMKAESTKRLVAWADDCATKGLPWKVDCACKTCMYMCGGILWSEMTFLSWQACPSEKKKGEKAIIRVWIMFHQGCSTSSFRVSAALKSAPFIPPFSPFNEESESSKRRISFLHLTHRILIQAQHIQTCLLL